MIVFMKYKKTFAIVQHTKLPRIFHIKGLDRDDTEVIKKLKLQQKIAVKIKEIIEKIPMEREVQYDTCYLSCCLNVMWCKVTKKRQSRLPKCA